MKRAPKGSPPAIVMINPKHAHNVGAVVRAASCWGLGQVWWTGKRVHLDAAQGERLPREERMRGYAEVEMHIDERPLDRFATGTPVAVELRANAEMLPDFEHPEDAIYVFGPEDGSLPKPILVACHRFLVIPTHHCLNLASAVNVVLYDRRVKRQAAGLEPVLTLGELLHDNQPRKAMCAGRGKLGPCEGPLYDYGPVKGVWCSYHASPAGNPHEDRA